MGAVETQSAVFSLSNLVKRFGPVRALDGVSLELRAGELLLLLGPNGAGKTTLTRVLTTLSRPGKGGLLFHGEPLKDRSRALLRREVGYLSHQSFLYAHLTAEENLRFYGRMYSIPNLNDRLDEVLELVGLAPRRRDLVRTFSRGMQQRLAIGRAILHDPEVMLFDEPHTGLDQDACDMLDQILRDVAARGRTVVMTSHDLARTADLASRFDILSRGQIAASVQRTAIEPNALLAFYRDALTPNS